MSGSDSSTQWIIVVVLVGVVGVVVCAGLGAAVFWVMPVSSPPTVTRMPATPTAASPLSVEQIEQQRQAFARAWRAPRRTVTNADEAEMAGLLPAEFDGWTLFSREDGVKLSALELDRAGVHAVYGMGAAHVDVYAGNVGDQEAQQVLRAALKGTAAASDAMIDGFLDNVHSAVAEARVVYGTPPRHAWLWWSQGCLFVFVTDDNSIDLESFQRAYLTRVQAPLPSPIEEL